MSIAQSLPEIGLKDNQIHPAFMQDCPFCGRSNRMVVNGLFVSGNKKEKHPDMGYSFCNCKNMFYARPENVSNPSVPLWGDEVITLPDPFFAWPDPYQFLHWDVRRYEIIWPMDSLCEHLKEIGREIVSAERDFDVHSNTPQHYHIRVKKV